MENFAGKIAVVTGGGTGMGRELVCQLFASGAHVAMCDVSAENMAETTRLAQAAIVGSASDSEAVQRITSHMCDVSSEQQVNRFRDEVVEAHCQSEDGPDHINLLFNNAGIGGGGQFVNGNREDWDRTFAVCWHGVYFGCRAFLDLLVASEEGHIINTSSVNGFWASLGPNVSHTSYAAAKFAVKGFTEALVTDLRLNAPHVHASVVMPGHIGTSIVANSSLVLGKGTAMDMPAEEVAEIRARLAAGGLPVDNVPDDHIREMMAQRAIDFRDKAPTTAAKAADVILQGVRAKKWRILIGDDAHKLDELVRATPEEAYDEDFVKRMHGAGHFESLVQSVE